MAAFYLDENVARGTREQFVALGDDAVSARTIYPQKTSDHVHLATAIRQRRILVTHDVKDFLLLHHAWHDWFGEWGTPPLPMHSGIIVIPQPPQLSDIAAADLLHNFVRSLGPGDPLANRFFTWSASNGWQEEF